jgi:ribosomal protein S18 acetylase RimI-like enzyme
LSTELRPIAPGDVRRLTELHNSAFSDYPIPARLDPPALQTYFDETGVRPELSRIAWVDGEPASFCLGAIRGDRGSIRGEGTRPQNRRTGLGQLVLDGTVDALRDAGAATVGLEVLDGNDGALELYRRADFAQIRRLVGFVVKRSDRPPLRERLTRGPLTAIDADAAVRLLAEWGWPDAPWQLQPESLAEIPAQILADSVLLFGKRRGDQFWLYAIIVDPAHRREGMATRAVVALDAAWVGVPALVPQEWKHVRELFASMGGAVEAHTQWEMLRSL